jgi:hypothetical protein
VEPQRYPAVLKNILRVLALNNNELVTKSFGKQWNDFISQIPLINEDVMHYLYDLNKFYPPPNINSPTIFFQKFNDTIM